MRLTSRGNRGYSSTSDLSNDDVALEDIVSHTKVSCQDRSCFEHSALFGLNPRVTNRLDASDIITTSVTPLPDGEEKYEFLLTVHYKTGEVVLRFANYLYTGETVNQFFGSYCNLIGTLGREPLNKICDVSAVSHKEHS